MAHWIRSDTARTALLALATFVAIGATTAGAQHIARGGAAVSPPPEARQFDFLIGHWELTVTPKASGLGQRIHGAPKLVGTWKAWRAFDGWGIEDELRIMDASGNPASLSHALRLYSAAEKQWSQTLLDVYRAKFTTSRAVWDAKAMTTTADGTSPEGKPTKVRSQFTAITANAFRWQQDVSDDGGRTWEDGTLKIEAKRVAATAPR